MNPPFQEDVQIKWGGEGGCINTSTLHLTYLLTYLHGYVASLARAPTDGSGSFWRQIPDRRRGPARPHRSGSRGRKPSEHAVTELGVDVWCTHGGVQGTTSQAE